MKPIDLGFDTIGNATMICYDKVPVLVTDPWIKGSSYFGSWGLSHEVPAEQMEAIEKCRYVWYSHGHPDHLNWDSIDTFK
ncbi:MAG: MBL fold metallo-hydrolase, partial [Bacteroidia bacterium]